MLPSAVQPCRCTQPTRHVLKTRTASRDRPGGETKTLTCPLGFAPAGGKGYSGVPHTRFSFWEGRVPLDLRFRGPLEAKSFVRGRKIEPPGALGRVSDLKYRSCGYVRRCRGTCRLHCGLEAFVCSSSSSWPCRRVCWTDQGSRSIRPRVCGRLSAPRGPGSPGTAPAHKIVQVAPKISPGDQL